MNEQEWLGVVLALAEGWLDMLMDWFRRIEAEVLEDAEDGEVDLFRILFGDLDAIRQEFIAMAEEVLAEFGLPEELAAQWFAETRLDGVDILERVAGTLRDHLGAAIAGWREEADATLADLKELIHIWLDEDNAERIAETEAARLMNWAILAEIRRRGEGRWRWQARLDFRTCPACLARHGMDFGLWDPHPPLHPRCRCIAIPVPMEA